MKINKWQAPIIPMGMFLLLAILLGACTGHKVLTRPFEPQQMIHFSQIKNWDESKSLNNTVIYLEKGDTFPLMLSMDTDFMAFKQDHIDMVAKERLYFMIEMPENLSIKELAEIYELGDRTFADMSPEQQKAFFKDFRLYLSKDAVRWAPLYSAEGLKKVLGFKTGMVSFGMMANTTDGLGASLNLKTIK